MEFLVRTIGNAVGLWLATTFIRGMDVPGTPTTLMTSATLLVVGLVLALVNSLIKPVARLRAFPLNVQSFCLIALVVYGAMMLITSAITDRLVGVGAQAGLTLGLHVDSFGSAILGSILVSIASALVVGVVGSRDD